MNTILSNSVRIDCGIGTIRCIADNLLLQQLIESLAESIEKNGAKAVLEMLDRSVKR